MDRAILDKSALDNLLATIGGDKAFLGEMIDTFLADSPVQIAAMKNATMTLQSEELRRAAHSLKSNAANFGALDLARLCKELEELGKGGRVESAPSLIAQIEAEYARAAIALRAIPKA